MSPYHSICNELEASNTKLVVVSKNRQINQIMKIYDYGHRLFGENKVQDLIEKYNQFPKDIEWHMIGHLQSNKVKLIAPFISMIHSVDSLKLLFEINKEAKKNNRIISVLIQMHIAQEETKYGADEKELIEILEYYTNENSSLKNIEIIGLMGMASNTDDVSQIQQEFQQLKNIFNSIKKTYLLHKNNFTELSMGMSSDYKIAIKEGSTMVRIGSLLF